VILYCFYAKDLKLDDGSDRSERELKNLIVFIANQFQAETIKYADRHSHEVLDICKKVRAVIFKQMTQHTFWTMFFGMIELILFYVGHFVFQPYSE
jgi:hypothetical protein